MRRFVIAAVSVAAALTLVVPGTAQASTGDQNLAPNPSFERVPGGALACWELVGTSASKARFYLTRDTHTGSAAIRVDGRAGLAGEIAPTQRQRSGCATPVTAGSSYVVSVWYRSTVPVHFRLTLHSTTGTAWQPWAEGPASGPTGGTWTKATMTTPLVPEGGDFLSVGIAFPAKGMIIADDLSVIAASPGPLFAPTFPATDTLVTNEYAYWNPQATDAHRSADWEMTSGSLFSRGGRGFTGAIDDRAPNATSTSGTNSAVFRLNTKRADFSDVRVGFDLTMQGFGSTPSTPAQAWDGVHIWLRYQSEESLYYASVARRDGAVVVKKKCPGGPSNGGTYVTLASRSTGGPIPLGVPTPVAASVVTNADGTVSIAASLNGVEIITARDTGVGCAAITGPGAVGIRGDNAAFEFSGFQVTA